jgi:hypothetical protein
MEGRNLSVEPRMPLNGNARFFRRFWGQSIQEKWVDLILLKIEVCLTIPIDLTLELRERPYETNQV